MRTEWSVKMRLRDKWTYNARFMFLQVLWEFIWLSADARLLMEVPVVWFIMVKNSSCSEKWTKLWYQGSHYHVKHEIVIVDRILSRVRET